MEILSAVGWLLIAVGIAALLIGIGGAFSPAVRTTTPGPKVRPESKPSHRRLALHRVEKPSPDVQAALRLEELTNRVLSVVRSHPEGVTLVEIGKELGIDWRQLIAPVNRLLAAGRVEKRERSYFPR